MFTFQMVFSPKPPFNLRANIKTGFNQDESPQSWIKLVVSLTQKIYVISGLKYARKDLFL